VNIPNPDLPVIINKFVVFFPPKIRDWEFCDEGLDNCGAGNKKETGAFIDLTLQVKSKGTPKKESKKDREKSKKKPICHKNSTCPEVYNLGGGSDVVLNNEVHTQ